MPTGYIGVLDIPENRHPNAAFATIRGHSMLPVLVNGWQVRVDTSATTPCDGDIVIVHFEGDGKIVGYWNGGENPVLTKANPAYEPVDVNGKGKPWRIWGSVTHVVSKPVLRFRRVGDRRQNCCARCDTWFDDADLGQWALHSSKHSRARWSSGKLLQAVRRLAARNGWSGSRKPI